MKVSRSRPRVATGRIAVALAIVASLFSLGPDAVAATKVNLGTADSFAVLAGSTVTNTGATTITGDIGVSPGLAVTGESLLTLTGTIHRGDSVAQLAKDDLGIAYTTAAGQGPPTAAIPADLVGLTLTQGVYKSATEIGLTGTLTLDAGNDKNAVWVFQAGSTLITSSGSRVVLQNGAQACNVFWQVGTSATLGTGTAFVGTIMADASIALETAATLDGRALARTGAVTLDTNTITRSPCSTYGSLQITNSTTNPDGATLPATSTGTYNCGNGYAGSWSAATGASQTIDGIPTGSVCSVTETVPAAIEGYTWGAPVYTPATVTISTKAGTFGIVVTNSISKDQDRGSFTITKSTTNPEGASLPAAFTGTYTCGTGYTGSWSVADGASQTISGIPTGSTCSVSETAPAAIAGYTWATPVYTPATVTIATNAETSEIVVTNSISRDRGVVKITKSTTNPDGASLPGAFTGTYTCGTGHTGSWSVADGASQTIEGIPTGSVCSVTEDALVAIHGYTWATPVYTPATITIATKAGTFEIVVTNSITKDQEWGSFKITKSTTNPDRATLPAAFTGTYDCGNGYTGSWSVADGGSQTIYEIPTGNTCSVTEDAPSTIDGYTWATPVYSPATITISTRDRTSEIVVTNSISRDRGTMPNAGATIPLAGLLAAIGLVSAGLILMGASRFNRRVRKN